MRCSKPVPRSVDSDPIGTGPLSWRSIRKIPAFFYTAFLDYRQGKAKSIGWFLALPRTLRCAYAKLEKNECQVMPFPNPADLPGMKENKTFIC